MPDLDPNKAVSLVVQQFPQNLLLPDEKNIVSLQITNHSNKEENFFFEVEGENLEVSFSSIDLEREVKFNGGETKNIELNLKPKVDGYGKLIINIYWAKFVEYIIKVQKVREKALGTKIKKVLKNKDFLPTETLKPFNFNEFFIETSKSDIKQMEKNLKSMKQQIEVIKNNEQLLEVSNNDINNQLRKLAKAYLSIDDFYKALETSLELSVEDEKIQFYYELLRAYANRNLEACLQVVKNLGDLKRKDQILAYISTDLFNTNPEEILKIILLIDSNSIKESTLLNIISKAVIKNDTQLALKFSDLIEDSIVKIKVLFNIIKILNQNDNKGAILPILNQINQTILNSETILLNNQTNNNPTYSFFKDSISIIAELVCPESADSVIKDIKQEDLREKIAKDLTDEIYEIVEETKTKIEKKIALSHSYSVNTYTSDVTREIKNFSLIGGNVSNNVLTKNYDFNFVLISLFSYNFSIFPIIDRLLLDTNYHSKKSFAYYLFPTISNHDEEELNIIKKTLNQFFSPARISKQMIIFNLDFIPYLGKPTIILSEENQQVQSISEKLEKGMKNEAVIIINNDFFKSGATQNTLQNIFQGNNFSVINLVLSYEFLNNYEVFNLFIEALI